MFPSNTNWFIFSTFNPNDTSTYNSLKNGAVRNQSLTLNYTYTLIPTITNFSIPAKIYGDDPFPITQPTTNSTGLFTYTSSDSSVATVSGNNIITIKGAGSATMTATQASTTDYNSGSVETIFQVDRAQPTITNFYIPAKIYGDAPFTITDPSSNSAGLFTYRSLNRLVATVSGNIITIVGAGSSVIIATQSLTTNYTVGTIYSTFQVTQSSPTNPTTVDNGDELLYFMETTSKYANIIDSLEINEKLVATSYKVLTGNNITITKSNN
jgi:hypothetical protein